MEKLANCFNTTIAKVVNIIACAKAISEAEVVADCCNDVIKCDVSVNEVVNVCLDCKDKLILVCKLIHESLKVRIVNLFKDTDFLGINVNECIEVNGVVADTLVCSHCAFAILVAEVDNVDTAVLDAVCNFERDCFTLLDEDFTVFIDNIFC